MEHESVPSRVRSLTELFRYEPPHQGAIHAWAREAAISAGLDPNRCALVTFDSPRWQEETAPTGRVVRILRKRGVILSDDGRAFSFTIVTGGTGNWEAWVERISDWKGVDPEERPVLEEQLVEARELLNGEVYFPPAKFLISYPPRGGSLPWGAILSAVKADQTVTTAFRRDRGIETSPLLEITALDVGG